VDDERLARQKLSTLLARRADVEVVGECADGESALGAIARLQPDLVFLDVRMPGLSGPEVAHALRAAAPAPQVVFVTAHAAHAVEAFDIDAVDYLLKPFDAARLARAVERVGRRREQPGEALRRLEELVTRLEEQAVADPAQGLLGALPIATSTGAPAAAPTTVEAPARLAVKVDGRTLLVRPADIDWIEAVGNYVRLHVKGARYLHREALSSLERRLQPASFVRIHRGTLVNLERVREIQPGVGDDPVVLLADGTRLQLSRRYRARLRSHGVPV